MYWEQRKSHIFPPFHGGGIPGLNMSEPGNKSIKPVNTMCLVTAAIHDVSHMVYQEQQLHLFNHNLLKCAGRGLTKEACDARDRAQQMRKAEEFAAIFDDKDALLLEAEQAMNPNSYLPWQNDIHRAPKDKKVGKGRAKKGEEKKKTEISIKKDIPKKNGGRGRGKVPSTSGDIWPMGLSCSQQVVSEDTLQVQVLWASEILDEEIVPDSQSNFMANPPLIVKATGMIGEMQRVWVPFDR